MKRSPLPPMSKKRQDAIPARAKLREAILERDGHRCQFWTRAYDNTDPDFETPDDIPFGCGGHDLDIHEIIPRSAWAAGWLVPSNCVSLCRRHHDWVSDHPEQAHTFGLHGYSHETPKDGTP